MEIKFLEVFDTNRVFFTRPCDVVVKRRCFRSMPANERLKIKEMNPAMLFPVTLEMKTSSNDNIHQLIEKCVKGL